MQEKLQKLKDLSQLLIFFSFIFTSIFFYNLLSQSQSNPLFDTRFFSQLFISKNSNTKTCDYTHGKWVWDETRPQRKYSEKCPFLDPGFRCQRNGRKDSDYKKWRWQPETCNLPRFDANDFLQRVRNSRIVFAGDSIGRNHWESLICMLTQGVFNQSTIFEEYGSPITKHKGFLSIKLQEYNLTLQYYRVPYLVAIDRPPRNAPKEVRGVIRVDRLHWYSNKWVGADILVFSAGHWWNQDKTIKAGHYFQEGENVNMTMDVMEAFTRSLNTLKLWVMENLEPEKSHIFFRSYSPVHFKEGEWNGGGHCNTSREPETDHSKLEPEPLNNMLIHDIVKQMEIAKRKVRLLNVTYLTEFRKDGHPSSHREPGTPVSAPQDCSHWCLPGVPDTWNEILYAELLKMGFRGLW